TTAISIPAEVLSDMLAIRNSQHVQATDPSRTRGRRRSKKAAERSSYRCQRRRRIERKQRLVEIRGGRCEDCGYDITVAALEFHHWDAREKKFGISRDGLSRPWEAIAAELLKCVMLCANCHREIHAGVRLLERQGHATVTSAGVGEAVAA